MAAHQDLFCFFFCFFCLSCSLLLVSEAHNDDDAPPPHCDRPSASSVTLHAAFRPGLITVDAISSDWATVTGGQTFTPLQAIQPDPASPYPYGSFNIKVAHDGRDIFFLLEFKGPYVYTQGDKHKCPSMALMFGIGDDATYNNMGGCKEEPETCSVESCEGHEVDLIHFSIGDAIPGRLYGGNIYDNVNGSGRDSFGSLNDMYAWNPHCRNLDGLLPNGSKISNSGAQNNWQGAWSHSSIDLTYGLTSSVSPYSSTGAEGTFVFEFSRPLRTSDYLQQDVQFTIGGTHRFMAGLWYPINNAPWAGYQHYTASCDWIPLEILPSVPSSTSQQSNPSSVLSIFAFVLSVGALIFSTLLFLKMRSKSLVPFQAIDGL